MTSFTRKLYLRSPKAAEDFARQSTFEHRMSYGKNVTLACFTPAHHALDVAFGKREHPPVQSAYEVWAPDHAHRIGKAILHATDSFQVRQEYANYHGLNVTDVCARRIGG